MALASLLAFSGGAGLEPLTAILAGAGLVLGFFWQTSPAQAAAMERIWLPVALFLLLRALVHGFLIRDDVVVPVVDLLFLLVVGEALRPREADNDVRLYALSFALLLASTAYRPGILFALAFTTYVGLAPVALTVGHLRRQGEQHRSGEIPIPRSFLGITAVLSGITLLFSVLVFLAFPRVSRGWAGRGEAVATSIAGFAEEVSLGSHGSRIFGNPQIVLRVEFPGGAPPNPGALYWRGRSYDRFDGVRWSRSPRTPPSLAPSAWYERWGVEHLDQRIYAAPLDARILFAVHPVLDVETHSAIQAVVDNAGDLRYWGTAAPSYTARSILAFPSPEELRSASGGYVPGGERYLQLPQISEEFRALADSLLGAFPTRYDKARALVDWFRREFTYTLDLPASAQEASLEHFLLARRSGHCEYFSTAMAVLLRTQGVPAREVNGFLGGEWSAFGDYLAVTQNQAHAWVEVWFPGFGWVPFDPTPAAVGEGFVDPAWFWPGRFFLDAVQHRWNKWVLDYSLEAQVGLFHHIRQALFSRRPNEPVPGPGRKGLAPPTGFWWTLGLLLLASLLFRHVTKPGAVPRSTRLFLQLRAAARGAGFPAHAIHSPLALLRHLESTGHRGWESARVVVEGYLADRYSGRPLTKADLRDMRRRLREARKALRKNPGRGDARHGAIENPAHPLYSSTQ
jgi:transglutaminase-like putative cysteine protease